jgi:hypothetical protein
MSHRGESRRLLVQRMVRPAAPDGAHHKHPSVAG